MKPLTRQHATARTVAAALSICCAAVTGCGLSGGVATIDSSLPPPSVTDAPATPPAQAVSIERGPTAEQVQAYLDAWHAADEWQAAADYAVALTTYVHALQAATPRYVPTPVARPAAPPRPTQPVSGGVPANAFLACVRQRESGGNYRAYNPSGAAGAYQVMPGTWNGYGGYASAGQAPPAVQDQFAAQLYARAGRSPWAGGQYAC